MGGTIIQTGVSLEADLPDFFNIGKKKSGNRKTKKKKTKGILNFIFGG